MHTTQDAYDQGIAEAHREIAAGRLVYFSGDPSLGWGLDLVKTLYERFGVEVVFPFCVVTQDSLAFEEGYNRAVEDYIDLIHGDGAFAAATAQSHQHRLDIYQDCIGH